MPSLSRSLWFPVLLLWFVCFLNYFDRLLLTAMVEPIMQSLQIDTKHFGLLLSVYLWVYALCSPLAGYLADRFGYARIIVLSLFAWSLVTLASAFARTFEMMLFFRILLAISQSFAIPAGVAMVAKLHPSSTRALAVALYLSGASVGSMFCSLGSWLAQSFSWTLAFQWAGSIGIVYALFLVLTLHVPEEDSGLPNEALSPPDAGEPSGRPIFSPLFLVLLAANGLFGAANWILGSWLPHFLHLEQGFGLFHAGILGMFVVNLGSLCGMLFFGRLSDKIGKTHPRRRALIPAVALICLAPLLWGFLAMSSMGPILGILILVGFATGSVDPNLMPLLCLSVAPERRATAYGYLNLAATASGGLAILLSAYMKDLGISFSFSFLAATGVFIVSGILFFCNGISSRR